MFDADADRLCTEFFGGDPVEIKGVVICSEASLVLPGDFAVKGQTKGITGCASTKRIVVPIFLVLEFHQVGIGPQSDLLDAGVGCVQQADVGVDVLNVRENFRWSGGRGSNSDERRVRFIAEDPVDLIDVGDLKAEGVDGFVGQGNSVECLLILAPADVADEGGVVIDDLLASDLRGRIEAFVLDIGLIEFRIAWICDRRVFRIEWKCVRSGGGIIVRRGDLGELAFCE